MDTRSDRQIAAAADRSEQARLDADLAAALRNGSVLVVEAPRPGFAARRRDRMLRVQQTREG